MDLFTFLLCKKKGGGGVTYTLSADTVNKQIVLTPSKGDAQAIIVPYATDASTVNGKDVPELENGKIPATYLPSYVDDILEYEDLAHFPVEGEVGKIYIARDTNLIYRWSGSVYAEINQSLALGETEATAYRGDRGKIAYDHSQSAHAPSNAEVNQNAFSNITVGDTTIEADSKTDTLTLEAGSNITLTPDASTDKVTITATDTTYSDATTSTSGLMSGSDKTKLNGIATGAEVNQNAFSNVKIGADTIAADSKTDTLELEAGTNIELTSDTTNDKVTISGIPVTRTIRDASVASFSDGADAVMQSLKVGIEPVQDLHGYDHPWAGGAGKNKLPLTVDGIKSLNTEGAWNEYSYTVSSVTFTIQTDNDGNVIGIKANGTATANASLYLAYPYTANFDCILNGCPENGSGSTYQIAVTGVGTERGSGLNISNGESGNLYLRVFSDYTANNLIFKPMIRLSTETDATFEPYSNICPISGWTEEVVTRCGKNLFDVSQYPFTAKRYINATNGFYSSGNEDYSATAQFIPCKHLQGKTITLNKRPGGGNTGFAFYENANTDTFISGERNASKPANTPMTVTVPSNANYMRFTIAVGETDIQLEIGDTATTYEPYTGTTTTIPFTDSQGNPVEVYGGSVDVVNGGEQQRTMEIEVFNENTNWDFSYNSETGVAYANTSATLPNTKYKDSLKNLCNIAKWVNKESGTLDVNTWTLRSYNRRFYIATTGFTTIEEWKTYLASNPITICAELTTPTTFYTQPTSIKSLDGENNVFASTGPLREVTYRTQAYGDFIATRDLPDAISDIKTLKLDENQILIGDGNFNKIGLFMDDYYDENLDTTFTTEVTPQEIYLTSQPAESVNQTTIISGDRTEYQTSLLSGTEVINTVNAIGMEVNVKENGSITHGIKIVSGDIRLLGSDTWDGTNISLKDALAAIQNNLYIANYNKTASLSSGSNTVALDMTGYTYNGSDIVNVYVDGLYKVNNTDYTITVNSSTGVASINYTAAAAATMAIQVIKPKIGFTALTDGNGDNVTDNSGNSIDI